MAVSNLYDAPHRFRLIIPSQSLSLSIQEPIGYREARINLKRDREYYGMNYEFFDDSVKVEFELDNGVTQLRTLYAADGSDAIAKFHHLVYNSSTMVFELLFEGNLDFNTYSDDGTTVSCEIEKVSFENLLRTRFDTKVSLIDATSLDGEASAQLQSIPITLHSKMILKRLQSYNSFEYTQALDDFKSVNAFDINQIWKDATFILLRVNPETLEGIKLNEGVSHTDGLMMDVRQERNYAISTVGPVPINYYNQTIHTYKAKEAGTWQIVAAIKLQWFIPEFYSIFAQHNKLYIAAIIVHKRENGTPVNIYAIGADYDLTSFQNGNAKFFDKSNTINNIPVLKGDFLTVEIIIGQQLTNPNYDFRTSGITIQVYRYTNNIEINAKTTAPATTANCYRLGDAIRKNISMVTNVNNALFSSFLKGEAYKFVITNGMIVRGSTLIDEPIKTSLKDLFQTVNAIWNCGVFIYNNTVTIEHFEWFFQNRFILAITETSDFKEETASELLFNEVEIGYEKTAQEDLQTLDEFNNRHLKLLPIKTFKKIINKLSRFIGSGYALEFQRRVQFDENTDKGGKYDADLFIISQSRTENLKAEKNEFMTALNIISPETSYNLRISPQRMALKWKSYIDSISGFKPETDATLTQSTVLERKGKLSLTWLSGAEYPIEINPSTATVENEPIYVNNNKKIFVPVYHKFKTRLNYQDFTILKKALTATFGNTKDNGYITYVDNNGKTIKGFVMDLIYSPISEECEFVCLKKYDKP